MHLADVKDKTLFDCARTKANPYELIGKSIFLNRAAVKLANLDALFDLTRVKPRQVSRMIMYCC
jgi:cap1 methyltransferase